ncbi:MAG TPA: glycosyl hydrolase family 28-related protein [Terriglobales bacterium]|nr:glycosyl hydrolase family 28-related protein [Terriglobales bacterium]
MKMDSRNLIFAFAFVVHMLLAATVTEKRLMAQTPYDLPNNDSGCPANCRQIPWKTGSDLWNGGSLPSYAQVTCTGLVGDGKTNDGPAIQTCINNAANNTAVYVPAGTYLINSTVRLKSNVVLRGAKVQGSPPFLPTTDAASTTFNLGASGWLTTQNFSTNGGLTPSVSYGCSPSSSCVPYHLSGTPTKGNTTVTISSGSVSANQWVAITSDDDPTLVSSTGEDGFCQWCGANNGYQTMQQIVQVTAVNGSTLTLGRPLYYKLYSNPSYRVVTFGTQKAGFENFRVNVTGDIGASQIITLQGCVYCWVKGVETYDTGTSSGSAHIELDYSYGAEIRDNYVHFGRSSASGANYGIYFQFLNSDHKIENNIMRNNRHSVVYQGGGSGTAILYNYIDDNYTDDLSYLGSARTSHGAHPYMNLWEGNIASHVAADDFWGSSSHVVFFRNWLWGDETGTGVPSFPPSNGFDAIDLYPMQTYYAFVGNVLGITGMHTNWTNATLRGFNEYASPSAPIIYSYGGGNGQIPSADTTSINHGNYDYKTNGVAYWEGGSNHTLKNSMYYSSKPGFFGKCTWPAFGPDLTPITNKLPAKARYEGDTSCSDPGGPAPPTNLQAVP